MEGRSPLDPGPSRRRVGPLVFCLAAMLAGCGGVGFIGTTSRSFLRHLRESDDPNVRYAAITKLANPGCYDDESQKVEAARELSSKIIDGHESVAARAAICRTLGVLGLPESRTALRKGVVDEDPIVRAQACRSLGAIGEEQDATILSRVMTADTSRDCRVAAIDALGALKPADPRIGLPLVEGMKNPDPAIRAASYAALQQISGTDLGLDVEPWEEMVTARLGNDAPTVAR